MKWLRCLFRGHVWRFRYGEYLGYKTFHNRDGTLSYGFGPPHIGWRCNHCGRGK